MYSLCADNMKTFIRDAEHTLVDWAPTDLQRPFDLPVAKLVEPEHFGIQLPVIQCEQALFTTKNPKATANDASVA